MPNPYGMTKGLNPGSYPFTSRLSQQVVNWARAMGLDNFRMQLSANMIWRNQGDSWQNWDWAALDDAINKLTVAGFPNIIFPLRVLPSWGTDDPAYQATDQPWFMPEPSVMRTFGIGVASRYNGVYNIPTYGPLRVHTIEIGNEDFNIHFSPVQTPRINGTRVGSSAIYNGTVNSNLPQPARDPQFLKDVILGCADDIRAAAAAGTKIGMGSIWWCHAQNQYDFIYYLGATALSKVDFLNIHYYSNKNDPSVDNGDYNPSITTALTNMNNAAAALGVSLPIHMTEIGWGTPDDCDEATQATRYQHVLEVCRLNGVTEFDFFTLGDNQTAPEVASLIKWNAATSTYRHLPAYDVVTAYMAQYPTWGIGAASKDISVRARTQSATVGTYYLSPDGNDDTGDGSLTSPWKTFAKAASLMVGAGSTFYCAPGDYACDRVTFSADGTLAKPITIKALLPGQSRLIQGGGSGVNYYLIRFTGDNYLFDGFELTCPDYQEAIFVMANNITIQHCNIHHVCNTLVSPPSGGGITNWIDNYDISGMVVRENIISWVGPISGGVVTPYDKVHGVYCECDNNAADGIVENNLIMVVSGWGIAMYHKPQHWLVTNNTVIVGKTGGLDCWGDSGAGFIADYNTIQNNIFMECGNGSWFPAIWSQSDDCGTHNIFRKNLAYHPTQTAVYDTTTHAVNPAQDMSQNLANANPLFVDYQADGSGDYRLQLTSPAVDTGTATSAPSVDLDGRSRPRRGGYDVGAYESSRIWYVSGNVATSGNGQSWGGAWKTFANIAWGSILPGDIIEVDGGTSGITYKESLLIGASGTAGNPIIIRASMESGHDGVVTQWGGRTTPLPYSGQALTSWQETATLYALIQFGNYDYVTIDGQRWHGWHLYGCKDDGINMGASSTYNSIRYLEINDCGTAYASGYDPNMYRTDLAGVRPQGTYFTVYGCDVHDCGQDCFQTGLTATYWTIERTWMHCAREHPLHPGFAYNQQYPTNTSGPGTHQDGFQEYAGDVSYLSFVDCLFGPGLLQGTIIHTSVSDVSYSQCLFLPGANSSELMADIGVAMSNFTIDHVTCASCDDNCALLLEGSGHSITNSIFTHGRVELNQNLVDNTGNIQWQNHWDTYSGSLTKLGGTTINPLYKKWVTDININATPFQQLLDADLTPQEATAIGKGCTNFTSVNSFLQYVAPDSGGPPPPVTTTVAQITGAGGVNTMRLGTQLFQDVEATCCYLMTVGGDRVGITLRDTGLLSFIRLLLIGANQLQLVEQTATAFMVLSNYSFTPSPNVWYWLKFRVVGSQMSGKVWADGDAEPDWQVLAGTNVTDAGQVGVAVSLGVAANKVLFKSFTATGATEEPPPPEVANKDTLARAILQDHEEAGGLVEKNIRVRARIFSAETDITVETYAAIREPLQRDFPKS